MSRPIVYDVTHLVARLAVEDPTGIDRVDLAFGRHFAEFRHSCIFASHYGRYSPRVMQPAMLRQIVRQAEAGWREDLAIDADQTFCAVKTWLEGEKARKRGCNGEPTRKKGPPVRALGDRLWSLFSRFTGKTKPVPQNAIYLNIAEFWLEFPRYFEWLGPRQDVRPVFFVHDLLPLDYPEYFRPGYRVLFQRRFDTMAQWGAAFIVSTNVVRDRLCMALTAAQRPEVPIYVAPLPSPLASGGTAVPDNILFARPYFVLVSTVEPRKNHLLVLNIWRELAALGDNDIARLVLIGARGWEHEQVADMLDRCEAIRPYIFEAARLSSNALARLLAQAQALLMPSFDEGYGLPIVEALTLGTPVIASDTATFREVTQGCALLLSPLDGMGWQDAIMRLSKRESSAWQAAKAKAAKFPAPNWDSYFQGVEEFLHSL